MTFSKGNGTIIVSNDTLLEKYNVKHKNFIKDNLFLFENVDNSAIDDMLCFDGVEILEYSPHDVILNSQTKENMGLIYRGNAVIRSGEDNVILRKLSVGDTFGAASLFDKHSYSTAVIATSLCVVISFNKEFIERSIAYNKTVALNYVTFLSRRISFLNTKIDAFSAKSAENKLFSYLSNLPKDEKNEVEITVSFSTLSKMLAIGRASLYRSFEKLENSGMITKIGKKIKLNEV